MILICTELQNYERESALASGNRIAIQCKNNSTNLSSHIERAILDILDDSEHQKIKKLQKESK